MEGTTAVERFRLRRQQRQLQAGTDEKNTPILPPQPPSSAKKRSSICFDDEDDDTYQEGGIDLNNASCTGISITGSPFKRWISLSGGAKRRSDRRRRTIVPTKPNGEYIKIAVLCIKNLVYLTLYSRNHNLSFIRHKNITGNSSTPGGKIRCMH